ncbi:MAG: MerR family transcriptional regulator, partial [Chloroflexota bacterium]
GQTGPGSKYDAGHLARLRLIKRLQGEHLPLAEIRHRLEMLDEDEIRELAGSDGPITPPGTALEYLRSVLGEPGRGRSATRSSMPALARMSAPVPVAGSNLAETPPRYALGAELASEPVVRPIERSQWERIVLAPDVELHIRRPLSRAQNKGIDRLVTIARELLEEDRS